MFDPLRAGIGAGALLAGIGVLYNYVMVTPQQHIGQQNIAQAERIVLISPKTGNRLVLSGNGFQFFDKQGDPLVKLTQSNHTPQLTLTQWREPTSQFFASVLHPHAKQSQPVKLKEGGSLDLHPTLVHMTRCAFCNDNVFLGLAGGPSLVLNSGDLNDSFSNFGLSETNRCFDAKSTCYVTSIFLDETLGFSMKSCKTNRGIPLSKTNKDEGCESVNIGSMPLDDGASISLRKDGEHRLMLGRATLTSPSLGGREITPISEITAFDKRGTVVWRIPGR